MRVCECSREKDIKTLDQRASRSFKKSSSHNIVKSEQEELARSLRVNRSLSIMFILRGIF